jgi:hypothetical protein
MWPTRFKIKGGVFRRFSELTNAIFSPSDYHWVMNIDFLMDFIKDCETLARLVALEAKVTTDDSVPTPSIRYRDLTATLI